MLQTHLYLLPDEDDLVQAAKHLLNLFPDLWRSHYINLEYWCHLLLQRLTYRILRGWAVGVSGGGGQEAYT